MIREAKLVGLVGLACCLAAGVCGCGSDVDETGTPTGGGGTGGVGGTAGSGGTGAMGGGGAGGGGYICPLEDVPCRTEVISEMDLQPEVAPGQITNQQDGTGWLSIIDATAGGPFAPDPHAYVYGRFTANEGLVKVDVGDEASLDTRDWDIAFRRYVIRINSGNSGPSCVERALLAGTPDYDSVDSVPDGLSFQEDVYFTGSCTLIEDGSGLGSAATALSGFWTYSQDHCLQMSGNVYILHLADDQHIKLTVTAYYSPPAAQEQCNTDGTLPVSPEPVSANIRVRWAYLQ